MRWRHAIYASSPHEGQALLRKPKLIDGLIAQHVSVLEDAMRRTDPAPTQKFALTFVNLSRSSTNNLPGRGGMALVLTMRVPTAKDAAGRQAPYFKHALLTADAHLDAAVLELAALSFIHGVTAPVSGESRLPTAHHSYKRYLDVARETPQEAEQILDAYIDRIRLLGELRLSDGGVRFPSRPPQHRFIYLAYPMDTKDLDLIGPAALVVSVLYHSRNQENLGTDSKIGWSLVDLFGSDYEPPPEGLVVRFVPEDSIPDRPHAHVIYLGRDLPWPDEGTPIEEMMRCYARTLICAHMEQSGVMPMPALPPAERDSDTLRGTTERETIVLPPAQLVQRVPQPAVHPAPSVPQPVPSVPQPLLPREPAPAFSVFNVNLISRLHPGQRTILALLGGILLICIVLWTLAAIEILQPWFSGGRGRQERSDTSGPSPVAPEPARPVVAPQPIVHASAPREPEVELGVQKRPRDRNKETQPKIRKKDSSANAGIPVEPEVILSQPQAPDLRRPDSPAGIRPPFGGVEYK